MHVSGLHLISLVNQTKNWILMKVNDTNCSYYTGCQLEVFATHKRALEKNHFQIRRQIVYPRTAAALVKASFYNVLLVRHDCKWNRKQHVTWWHPVCLLLVLFM